MPRMCVSSLHEQLVLCTQDWIGSLLPSPGCSSELRRVLGSLRKNAFERLLLVAGARVRSILFQRLLNTTDTDKHLCIICNYLIYQVLFNYIEFPTLQIGFELWVQIKYLRVIKECGVSLRTKIKIKQIQQITVAQTAINHLTCSHNLRYYIGRGWTVATRLGNGAWYTVK